MLGRLLAGTEWSELGAYLSPNFWQVVPRLAMANRLRELTSTYLTRRGFDEALRAAALSIDRGQLSAQLRLPLVSAATAPAPTRGESQVLSRGDIILRLYFSQLTGVDTAVLDYRFGRFTAEQDQLVWRPAPLYVAWDPAFLRSVRGLYHGFYGERGAAFDEALAALGLAEGKAVLLRHFGDNQAAVRFRLADFRVTFAKLFAAAKTAQRKLPADFLPFGIGLVCLYEHLETLGGSYDVRAAYLAAVAGLEASS